MKNKSKKLSKALIEFNEKPLKEIIAMQQQTVKDNVKIMENGMTISISKLPDSKVKERLSNIVMDATQSKVVVVALLDKDDKWRAYIGYPDIRDLKPIITDYTVDIPWMCQNVRDRIQVMMMGELLPKEVAGKLFPDWDIEKYKY